MGLLDWLLGRKYKHPYESLTFSDYESLIDNAELIFEDWRDELRVIADGIRFNEDLSIDDKKVLWDMIDKKLEGGGK